MLMFAVGLVASASGLHTPQNPVPKQNLATAFGDALEKQRSQAMMQRAINKLAHPDVPLWLVFEGIAQPAVIPGSATTNVLHGEAARLHNLDANQRLNFIFNGQKVPLGIDMCDSPLANSQNQQVHVRAPDWPVKRGYANPSTFSATKASAAVPASQLRRDYAPAVKTQLVSRNAQAAHNLQNFAEAAKKRGVRKTNAKLGSSWHERTELT